MIWNKIKLKHFFRYGIWIVSFILSYLIPKKENLYIFWSINGKTFSWNSKALFLYYKNNIPKKEIYYMTRNRELLKINKINFKYINTLESYWLFLRAEFIFTDCDLYDVNPWLSYQFWNFSVINLWHWDPIKSIWYFSWEKRWIRYRIFKNYFNNVVIFWTCSSPFFKEIFLKWHLTSTYKNIWLPRNDVFFRDDLDFFDVKKTFQLNKYNQVILYTPTWRQDTYEIFPFSEDFLEELNTYLISQNKVFIIKSHQNSNTILKKEYSHILDLSKNFFDIQELMKYSHLLITDYSSIFIDFLLLNRPVLFYAYDYDYYSHNLVNLVDTYENCVIKEWISYDEATLLKLLKVDDLFKNENYNNNFYTLKNKYHQYQNGEYCKRVIKELMHSK